MDADAAHPRKDPRRDQEREVKYLPISQEMYLPISPEDVDAAHPRRDQRKDLRKGVMYLPTCPEDADAAHPRKDQRKVD